MVRSTEFLLKNEHRRHVLCASGFLTFGMMVVLIVQGRSLTTGAAPCGIVSLELAGSTVNAEAILRSWSSIVETAQWQIVLDFPFLVFYSVFLSFLTALLSRGRQTVLTTFGAGFSWAVLAAAPLDATENLAMLGMLSHGPSPVLVKLATFCAIPKFALILGVPVFAAARLVGFALNRKGKGK